MPARAQQNDRPVEMTPFEHAISPRMMGGTYFSQIANTFATEPSRDDLIVQALGHAIGTRKGDTLDLRVFMDECLSPRHRDDTVGGCPIAGLAADTLRQTPEARSAVTDGVRAQIDWMSQQLAGPDGADGRRQAIASWAAIVGATILARAITDPAFSDE